MSQQNDVKDLLEELGHMLWASQHPMMMIDKSIVDLLQRCHSALRTLSEQPGKEDV